MKAWHGVKLHLPDWSPWSHSLALGAEVPAEDLSLHMILNAYWEPLEFELPYVKGSGGVRRRWIDTALDPPDDIVEWRAATPVSGRIYSTGSRSVVVLLGG
jgi:glycogen operon protein